MKTINSFRSKLLALTFALVGSVSSFAKDGYPDFQVDGLYYNFLEGDSVQVTFLMPPAIPTEVAADTSNKKNVSGAGYGHLTEIVIPSTVIYEDKTYHVTRIGHGAFMYCPNLMHIDLPTSIKSIGKGAFHNCRYLSSITLNEGLESIEQQAFYDCVRLKEVTLPSTLKTMGQGIFYFSADLEKVTCKAIVPPSVEKGLLTGTDNYNASIIPNATLYVPAESLEAYKTAAAWKEFGQILPIEPTSYKSQWCDTWNVLELKYRYISYTTKEDFETWRYYLAQDTIINNYTYTAVTRQTTKVPEGVYPFTIPEPEYVAAVRFTEDSKVYIYYDNTEYLLYDFNVQPGDELTVFAGINHYHSHHTNTIRVDEVERYPGIYPFGTEISLTVVPNYNHSGPVPTCAGITKWIEGVGDICGLITGADCGLSDDQSALLCAYKDGNTEYTTEEEEYAEYGCEYNSGENKEYILTLPGLQRTVYDEFCGEAEIGAVYTGKQTFDKIFFENDKPYILCNGYLLREEDNKILIYSQLLNKDLVLYDFTLEVGDSLPALYIDYHARNAMDWMPYNPDVVDYNKDFNGTIYPADIFVVTDISNVTLLDGKEYKKWTFNNGMEYVEGIGMYGGHRNGNFFGLIQEVVVPCHIGTHLVCVSKNNKLLYQMDDAEMERLGAECLCDVEKKWSDTWCDTWNVMEHDMGMTSDTEKTWRHYLANDTIINGQTYTSVNYYWTLEESKVYKIAHVRFSEDKKVYALMDDTEYLVYDFSVQVGDTIETIVGAFSGSMLQQLLVHQIDIDGATNRKTITLYPICRIEDDEYDEDWVYLWDCCPVQWIEGVGSTDGFLMGYPPCGWVGGIGHKLLCAYKDDELQYINDLYQDDYGCEYNAVGKNPEDLFPTLWGLQRTDVELHTTGDDEAYRSAFNEYVPTLVNGKWYLYDGRNYLREENNQVLLYAPDVEIYEDIVLYDWTLEVGDTLPYHNKSVYRKSDYIVTDVSTITLLDGKEYKKWTLACGYEYIESIGAINGHGYGLFLCLPHYGHWATYIHTSLVCASRNGQLLYQMDDEEMERLGAECLCDYNSGPKKDNAKNGKIGGRPTPTQWNMLEVEAKEMDGTPTIVRAETFSYTLENDSIVANNKTYYQLARQSTKDTAITKSFVGALHFGEDEDNRVYFLRDGVEYVLYDFTAEPGDTIEIFAGINNYPQETTYTHVVTGKDTLENGACRMMLEVVFPEETASVENAQKVWLAGLGSIDGIVHNAAQRTSDAHAAPAKSASSETQTSVMLCAWREDSCLYTTNHPEYDTFGCVYNQDPTAVEDVQTSGDKYQKIIRDGHLYILRDNKLYDILGTPMN